MSARIAVHAREGSFSDRWLPRARELGHEVVPVDCLRSDILKQLRACDALMWNWAHTSPADQLVARSVIRAAEHQGLHVFPSTTTCWHFDDKLSQKYALEAIGAPLAPTTVFFNRDAARDWCRTAPYPIVFKLRRGAGSANVRLLTNSRQALAVIDKAFGAGFPVVAGYGTDVSVRFRRARRTGTFLSALLRAPRTIANIQYLRRALGRERGYVMFQEYLPGNTHDTRVTVIGNRAFAFIRGVRPNDFRASGSGRVTYDPARIDTRFVQIAFQVTSALRAQSLAFDFILDRSGAPAIVEISYNFVAQNVHDCPGHWDPTLQWHFGHVWPQDAILDDVIAAIRQR